MFSASVDLQTVQHLSTKLVFRKHASNSQLDDSSRVLFRHAFVRNLFEVTRVLAVSLVDLLLSLHAGDLDLLGVNNNDKIASQHVWYVGGLVLAHQIRRHLSC